NHRPFYLSVDGVPEEIMLETLDEVSVSSGGKEPILVNHGHAKGSKRPLAREPGDVTASMPGTIVEVLVKIGDTVAEGDPILITEAMKMETEIQAPISGTIKDVHVNKGDSVNPDETLVEIG
ncbi:MAG: biotin/lipoyl-binding protein, partial [Gammaproteobacteria bacterium]|nr:biotin/lipoyl-binding protein [Gammaproteobacteria bacterium]